MNGWVEDREISQLENEFHCFNGVEAIGEFVIS